MAISFDQAGPAGAALLGLGDPALGRRRRVLELGHGVVASSPAPPGSAAHLTPRRPRRPCTLGAGRRTSAHGMRGDRQRPAVRGTAQARGGDGLRRPKRRTAMRGFLGDGAEVSVERDGRPIGPADLPRAARAEAERQNHA